MIKLIYRFLIFFGVLGLIASVFVACYAISNLNTVKSDVAQMHQLLLELRPMIEEASTSLKNAKEPFDELSTGLELAERMTTEAESTIKAVLTGVDGVADTIDSVSETLYEVADVLDAFSKNDWVKLFAGDVAKEAEEAALSMRETADSLAQFKPTLNIIRYNLKIAEQHLADTTELMDLWNTRLRELSGSITLWSRRLQVLSQSLEYWITRLEIVMKNSWLLEYAVYGFIAYIGAAHISLILIGIALKHLASQINEMKTN